MKIREISLPFVMFVVATTFSLPANSMYQAPPIPITKKYKIERSGGGKLYTTTASIKVLADPRHDSEVISEYGTGAIMVVIGQVKGTEYFYVSPCSACENGFVLKTEFLSKSERP